MHSKGNDLGTDTRKQHLSLHMFEHIEHSFEWGGERPLLPDTQFPAAVSQHSLSRNGRGV